MQEYIDAVSLDVMITEIGILVAGFAAVLGIWLERDHTKPPRYAWWLSLLIILCTFVGMFQTLADAKEGAKLETDMARMLSTLDKIAQNSDVEIPELNEFVKSEVSAQARSNPDVVKKVAQRVADEGGDPAEMLGSYLPPGEVQNVARRGGLNTRTAKVQVAKPGGDDKGGDGDKPAGPKTRRKLEFGGKAKVREPESGGDRKGADRGADKGGDDDGKERRGLRGRDDDDKKGDKDDDKKGDKDDDKDRKGSRLGGRDDKDDDKGKPSGSSAPAAGRPAIGGRPAPPGPGGAPKPPTGGAAPPGGGVKRPGAGR